MHNTPELTNTLYKCVRVTDTHKSRSVFIVFVYACACASIFTSRPIRELVQACARVQVRERVRKRQYACVFECTAEPCLHYVVCVCSQTHHSLKMEVDCI